MKAYVYCNSYTINCHARIKVNSKKFLSSRWEDTDVTCSECGTKQYVLVCTKCEGTGIEWPCVYDRPCCECSGTGLQATEYPSAEE